MKEKIIKNKISIGIIALITTTVMFIVSITIYSKFSKPYFYNTFIEQGYSFINSSNYKEAILCFEKATQIEPKSIEAKIGSAKGYIGINNLDKGLKILKETQELDIENTNLLLEILDIVNNIDSQNAYYILQNYIDKTQNSIPKNIQQIINNSNENPKIPKVNYSEGIYINPISIKIEMDNLVVGNTFYYTLDGTNPSKQSIKYSKSIEIKEDTTIKLIAYNHKGESSEIITLDYYIDNTMMNNLKQLIKESELLIENTQEGTDFGNCIKGSKEKLKTIIDEVKTNLEQEAISYDMANTLYKKLKNALYEFNYNIIEKTDKSKLKEMIQKSQNIYDKSVEGTKEGQYKVGSKSKLLSTIKESQKVYDDILSKQKDIDNSIDMLNKAIDTFNNSKVILFNKQQAINLLKIKYTNEIDRMKREEFKNSGFILESNHTVSDEGIIKGKKYYEIIYSIKMYLESGEMYYNEMYEEYVESDTFGTIFHVYEDGYIEEVEYFN